MGLEQNSRIRRRSVHEDCRHSPRSSLFVRPAYVTPKIGPLFAGSGPGPHRNRYRSRRMHFQPDDLRDATLRQIVHLSLGGRTLRVHLSNAFGTMPLHLTAVHIARPGSPSSPAIDPGTDKALTFHGGADVTIPAGAEFISDPVDYAIGPFADLSRSASISISRPLSRPDIQALAPLRSLVPWRPRRCR